MSNSVYGASAPALTPVWVAPATILLYGASAPVLTPVWVAPATILLRLTLEVWVQERCWEYSHAQHGDDIVVNRYILPPITA